MLQASQAAKRKKRRRTSRRSTAAGELRSCAHACIVMTLVMQQKLWMPGSNPEMIPAAEVQICIQVLLEAPGSSVGGDAGTARLHPSPRLPAGSHESRACQRAQGRPTSLMAAESQLLHCSSDTSCMHWQAVEPDVSDCCQQRPAWSVMPL